MFTSQFRNRPDAAIAFAPLSRATIDRVIEKFVLELETQLIDRDVTFDLTPELASSLIPRLCAHRYGRFGQVWVVGA